MPFCQCKDKDTIVWIDCTLGRTNPMPARYATKLKDLREHWTMSFFQRPLQLERGVLVVGVKCGECFLEVQ